MNKKTTENLLKNFKLYRKLKKILKKDYDNLTSDEINVQLSHLITEILMGAHNYSETDKLNLLLWSAKTGSFLFDNMKAQNINEDKIVMVALNMLHRYFMSRYPKDKFPNNPYLESNKGKCNCPICCAKRENKKNMIKEDPDLSEPLLDTITKCLENIPGFSTNIFQFSTQEDLLDFLKKYEEE